MKRLWNNIYIRHIIYWLSAYTAIFISVIVHEEIVMGLEIATLIIIPAPLPVYLHFLSLSKLFAARKYLLYVLSFIPIVVISGLWGEYIFNYFFGGPGSHTSGYLMVLFYIAISTALKYFSEVIQNKYRLQEVEFNQLQTEMSLLKSQINPHFFFNTLNNLYALSLAKSEEVPSVILKLSDLMRYVLETSKKKFVPLNDEIEFLQNYIDLERLRLENNFEISFNVSGDVNGFIIAPMLLVPFVENSFKHGIGASNNGGFLNIKIQLSEKCFNFSIVNNKTAENAVKNENSSHMGLANVKRRLELAYPGKHELSIENKNESFEVKLEIAV